MRGCRPPAFGLWLARVTIRVIAFRRLQLAPLLLAACGTDLPVPGPDDGGPRPPEAGVEPDLGWSSPDAAEPPVRCVSYSPASYFYEVTLGRTELLRFTLRNTCRAARRIDSVRVVGGDGAFELLPLPLPITLEPDALYRVPVRFSPLEPKSYAAQVAVELDDPGQPEFRVRITGEGVGGELRPLPSRVELGGAPVGCRTATRTVALWNEGPGPMFVFSVELAGPDADAFSLRLEPGVPRDVPAFEGLRAALGFAPQREGEHEAELLVRYNGRQSPGRVPLRAHGVLSRAREERFSLLTRPAHDLVFLAPPSSLERGEREALLSFVRAVRAEDELDLRLIVTPSGARDAVLGVPFACPGFPSALDVQTTEAALLEVLLPCMLSVATNDQPSRSSAALVSLLERHLAAESPSESSLRAAAPLSVVFTTFEDAWRVPIELVLAYLGSVPPELPPGFAAHAYERPAPGQPSLYGPRHHAIVQATGGSFVDPRSGGWTHFFEALHRRMREGPRVVVPALAPVPGSLSVLDAVTSATVAHALAPDRRRVLVEAREGRALVVRYQAACGG